MGDRPGLSVVRPWMLQRIGVAKTRGEDCWFRGEQRAWLSPHRVLRATRNFNGNLGQTKQFTVGPLWVGQE